MILYDRLSDLISLKGINILIVLLSLLLFLLLYRANQKNKRTSQVQPDAETPISWKEQLEKLVRRYNLESLTIATRDGFVVLSSSPSPEADAASFSSLYRYVVEDKGIKEGVVPIASESGVAWVAPMQVGGMDETLCVMRSEAGIRERVALRIKNETERLIETIFMAS